MKSLEKIVEETAAISQGFENNLEKRQELLQQITAKLDQRIQAAQDLCARLEKLSQATIPTNLLIQNSSTAGRALRTPTSRKCFLLPERAERR